MKATLSDGEDEAGTGTGRLPLYQIVANALRTEILSGDFPVGSMLPSEGELSRRFEVSRQTVRAALRALTEDALVRSQQGVGTIVRRAVSDEFVHHVDSFHDMFPADLFPGDLATIYDEVSDDLMGLPPYARDLPAAEAGGGKWLRVAGRRFTEQHNTVFAELEVFIAERFSGIRRVLNAPLGASLGQAIAVIYGEAIGEVEQMVHPVAADDVRGRKLDVAAGAWVMEVCRVYKTSRGDVAVVSFNRYLLQNFALSMTFRRPRNEEARQ